MKVFFLVLTLVFGHAAFAGECAAKLAERTRPFLIAVAGGSASGKTTIAKRLVEIFGEQAVMVSQDWYYDFEKQPKEYYIDGVPNFDHPTGMNFPLMRRQLAAIKAGETVWVPGFDFPTCKSIPAANEIGPPAKIVVFEGIHALIDPEIRALMDLKVFIDEDADTRLARRITRDIKERGQNVESVLKWYFLMAKPMHGVFVEPSKAFADIVVSGDGDAGEAEVLRRIREAL